MTQTNTTPQSQVSLANRMLIGAAIGFLVIASLLSTVGNPDPSWGTLWMIRPLLVVTFAGAMGGLCTYYIIHFHNRIGVNKAIAMIISVLVSIAGLWMGIVLGLNGTLWN